MDELKQALLDKIVNSLNFEYNNGEHEALVDPYAEGLTPEMINEMNNRLKEDELYKQMLLNAEKDEYNGPKGDLMYELYHPNSPRFNKNQEEFNPYDL